MSAKELHDRLEPTEGWSALPAAWKALLEDFDAALGDTAATLFNAQQALLTEGQARAAAEKRAEKAEGQWELDAVVMKSLSDDRDTLAAQLAECVERLKRITHLGDSDPDCNLCGEYLDARMIAYEALMRLDIESRRAKEAER